MPFGILEKHGPAGPLGTDLINVRFATLRAAREEYAIVFPEYYVGQIFEARHQPGTIAYSSHLQLAMLQETVTEMARNGCQKILIVNGHGGNTQLIQYFAQTQLDSPKDYIVYALMALGSPQGATGPAAPSRPGVVLKGCIKTSPGNISAGQSQATPPARGASAPRRSAGRPRSAAARRS